MTSLSPVLEKHRFFADIETRHIHRIAEHASPITLNSGELIFRQGEPANHFYIITSGHVALEVFAPGRGPLTIMTIGTDDVLGWSWLFEPYIWHFDAQAMESTTAIMLDGAWLRAACESDHELGYQLMKHSVHVIEQRLQAAMIQLLDMYKA